MKINRVALMTLRKYLDDMRYSLIDFRLSHHVEMSSLGFPTIQSLRHAVRQLEPTHSVVFRLFRIGDAVDDESVRNAIPAGVFDALIELELLIRDETSKWRTPSLLIVPAEGLYLMVGIPAIYSTASKVCQTGFDFSSTITARSLPVSFSGLRVLDICSGSGILALLCAKRGADSVVGLELNEEAVLTSRANAILNDLEGKVDFRQSDKLAALKEPERFDFFVCNTPSSPMIGETGEPATVEEIGNVVLLDLLEKLPDYLQPGARGIVTAWRSFGFQSRTYQLTAIASQLAKRGCSTVAYVDQAPNTIESILRGLQTEIERRPGTGRADSQAMVNRMREMLHRPEKRIDGAYNQLLFIERGNSEAPGELRIFPLFAATAGNAPYPKQRFG